MVVVEIAKFTGIGSNSTTDNNSIQGSDVTEAVDMSVSNSIVNNILVLVG
jgi:hypothetical protein